MKPFRMFAHTAMIAGISAMMFVAAIATAAQTTKSEEKKTAPGEAATATALDNLQAAYDGESNAKTRYEAFAKKADEEGYTKIASLFRAAAHAESVHISNHVAVIKKMGGEPKADIKAPDVKSTKENLEAAIKGETYETEIMYPGFIKQARDEKNKDALKTFNGAKAVEAEHAKLFKQALENLDQGKGGAVAYYVCKVCGYTAIQLPKNDCPICSNPKDNFDKVK
ncbi:MAG: ferritin-like domain-containing protein [Candidatus Sumerlaeota bacterium]|nr:ferritin-like domain-containing protein [Candidatus Sumerlaeota bacterium]